MEWLAENWATLAAIAVLVLIVALALRNKIKKKGCGCGCAGCPECASHPKPSEKHLKKDGPGRGVLCLRRAAPLLYRLSHRRAVCLKNCL